MKLLPKEWNHSSQAKSFITTGQKNLHVSFNCWIFLVYSHLGPYRYVSFDELAETSDIIAVCVDAATCSPKMFNKEYFKKMKNSAVFVNISRGLLVDHDDLYEAMNTGEIAGAGLDVTDPEPLPISHPLFSLDQCCELFFGLG